MMNEALINSWVIPASVMIAALLAMRFVLRGKISLRLQYALWAVVLVRLLFPGSLFTSQFSTDPVAEKLDLPGTIQQVYFSANEDQYDVQYDIHYRGELHRQEAQNQPVDFVELEREAADFAHLSLELDMKRELFYLWLMGMAVMTAVIVTCNIHLACQLRKRRRQALDIPDCLLPVYVTDAVPTPCVFGFFRPAIYLTPDAAEDAQVRTHVLAHELTHYRHCDHIWSVLRSLCLVLHWYNPLVWIAAKVSRADAELACDEGALARLGEEARGDYGRTLISLTCPAPVSDLLLTATTMTGSAGSIRERIKLLMARPRNTVLTVTAVILMVTLIVGCTFAGAPETTAPTEPVESTPAQTASPSDPTGHAPENDMSYQGQDLPIPDDLSATDLLGDDGLLVFPGTRWGMTEADLLEALDIQEYDTFSGMRGIHLADTAFCGFPASIAFYFDQYRLTDEWGLCDVTVRFENEADANAVYDILHEQLGDGSSRTGGEVSCVWWSDSALRDQISPEAWTVYQDTHTTYFYDGQDKDHLAASSLAWFGEGIQGQENMVCFSSRLNLARQIDAALGMEPADTTPPTAELPVSIDPATLFNAEGVLVYPGFEWFMTENEVLEVLGITAQDCLEYQKTSGDGMTANGFMVKSTDAFGVPMVLNFTFRSYWLDVEPGLTEVYARFENPADFEAVRALYAQLLGETDVQMTPGREEQWNGKVSFKDVLHKEGYEVLQLCAAAGADVLMRPASHIIWGSGDSGWIEWRTEIPVRDTMLYQAPPMTDAIAAYADKNPRELTEKELKEFRTAFATMDENGNPNPAACFLYPYYDEIYEMDGSDFLAYFPTDQEGTKEEFELLKAKYPDFFGHWTFETMPLPIHCYDPKAIEAVVSRYGNIHWPELDEGVHYLEETGCYYNYTSDFGLGGFYAREGFVFDGGAVVYSDFSALYFTETAGNYTIRAHLPTLAAE